VTAILYGLGVLVCYIATFGLSSKDENGPAPLPRHRRWFVMFSTALIARAILFVSGFYWIKVKGRPSYDVRRGWAVSPGSLRVMLCCCCCCSVALLPVVPVVVNSGSHGRTSRLHDGQLFLLLLDSCVISSPTFPLLIILAINWTQVNIWVANHPSMYEVSQA
jgi:hypothetical protein